MASIIGIYEIRNTVNGHRYIGSSVNVNRRWIRHKSDLQQRVHHSQYLQHAWDKYGSTAFVFYLIEECDREILVEREQFYIDTIHPEYNISPKAGTVTPNYFWLGKSRSVETRKKISKSLMGNTAWNKGISPSKSTLQKMSDVMKGRPGPNKGMKLLPLSEAVKKKISEALKGHASWSKGRIASEESRRKMSESAKRSWENRRKKDEQ